MNPEKTEAVKIQVHENYTNWKAAETSDDKENRLKSNRDYKRRKLEAMTDDERKERNFRKKVNEKKLPIIKRKPVTKKVQMKICR